MDTDISSTKRPRRPTSGASEASQASSAAGCKPVTKALKPESGKRPATPRKDKADFKTPPKYRLPTHPFPTPPPVRRSVSREEEERQRSNATSSSPAPVPAKSRQRERSKSSHRNLLKDLEDITKVDFEPRRGRKLYRDVGTGKECVEESIPATKQAAQLLEKIHTAGVGKNWEDLRVATERYNFLCRKETDREIPLALTQAQNLLIQGKLDECCEVLNDFQRSSLLDETSTITHGEIAAADYLEAFARQQRGDSIQALRLLVTRKHRPEVQFEIDCDLLQTEAEESIINDLFEKSQSIGSISVGSGCSSSSRDPEQPSRPICKHEIEFVLSFVQDPVSAFMRSLTEGVPSLSVIGIDDEKHYTRYIEKQFYQDNQADYSSGKDTNFEGLIIENEKKLIRQLHEQLLKTVPSRSELDSLFKTIATYKESKPLLLLLVTWLMARGQLDKAKRHLDNFKIKQVNEDDDDDEQEEETGSKWLARAVNVRRALLDYMTGSDGMQHLEMEASKGNLDAIIWIEKLAVDTRRMRRYSQVASDFGYLNKCGPDTWHIPLLVAIILNTRSSHEKRCTIPNHQAQLHRIVLSCKLKSKLEYILLVKAFSIIYISTRTRVLTKVSHSETFLEKVGLTDYFKSVLEAHVLAETNKLLPICDGGKLNSHINELQQQQKYQQQTQLLSVDDHRLATYVDVVNWDYDAASAKLVNLLEKYESVCCPLSGVLEARTLLFVFKSISSQSKFNSSYCSK